MSDITPYSIDKSTIKKIRKRASKSDYGSRMRILQYHPEAVFTKEDNLKMIEHIMGILIRILLGLPVICDFCNEPIKTKEELDLDHKIPVGGRETHIVTNVVPCHKWCNRQKGRMMPNSPKKSIRGNWHCTRYHYRFRGVDNNKNEDCGTFKRTTRDKKGNLHLDMEGVWRRSEGNEFLLQCTNFLRHPTRYVPEGKDINKIIVWIDDADRLIFKELPWEGKYLRMRQED